MSGPEPTRAEAWARLLRAVRAFRDNTAAFEASVPEAVRGPAPGVVRELCDAFAAYEERLALRPELRLVLPETPGISDPKEKAEHLQGWTVAAGRTCHDHKMAVLVVVGPEFAARSGTFVQIDEIRQLVECVHDGMAQCVETMFPGVVVERVQLQKLKGPGPLQGRDN